jgi:hypothetical protein
MDIKHIGTEQDFLCSCYVKKVVEIGWTGKGNEEYVREGDNVINR